MQVTPIPCLSDNYAYLVVCERTGLAALVDASEAEPVERAVRACGRGLRAIWSTHHHPDHVGGNDAVAAAFGVKEVVGHVSDRGRIPGQTRFLETGASFDLGALHVETLHIPGHTLGAIAYVVTPEDGGGPKAVFTGDTLFLSGCGRLFEGTPAQMHDSLSRLARLPDDTRVYCGHEYTAANLRFARHVEPGNRDVATAAERVSALRAEGAPTVPGTVGAEKRTNPFLRSHLPEIRAAVGVGAGASDVDAFAALRRAKDTFR